MLADLDFEEEGVTTYEKGFPFVGIGSISGGKALEHSHRLLRLLGGLGANGDKPIGLGVSHRSADDLVLDLPRDPSFLWSSWSAQ